MATAVIIDKNNKTTRVYQKTRSASINNISNGISKVTEILPFRVRFTNIGIRGAFSGVPPIGIAIIGVNNYILWYNLVYGYHSYCNPKV